MTWNIEWLSRLWDTCIEWLSRLWSIEWLSRLWNFRLNPFKADQDERSFINLQKRISRVPDANLARAALLRSLLLLDQRHRDLGERNRIILRDIIGQLQANPGFPDLSSEYWEAFFEELQTHPYLGDDIGNLEKWHDVYVDKRADLGSNQEEVDEAVELASDQQMQNAPGQAPAAPLERPPARYNNIATALGAIGTLGGSVTYAALLTLGVTCNDPAIRALLAYASVCFFGSLFTSIPVVLAVGNADEKQDLPSHTVWFLWLQLFFAALMDSVAYVCLLLVVLHIALAGPYFVGFAIYFAAILWCLVALMGRVRLWTLIPQIIIFVVLIIVTALVPAGKIGLANRLSRKHPSDTCYTPPVPPPPPVNCCCPSNSSIVMNPIIKVNLTDPGPPNCTIALRPPELPCVSFCDPPPDPYPWSPGPSHFRG